MEDRKKALKKEQNRRYHLTAKGKKAAYLAQRRYMKKNKDQATQRYQRYTEEDLRMLELIEKGEYTITQVAEMLERSVNGVVMKLQKMRRERKNEQR